MKSIAQMNVQYKRKGMIMPTSIILAFMELFTLGMFTKNFLESEILGSILLALVIGTGGGLGSMVSLDFHHWLSKKIYKWDK